MAADASIKFDISLDLGKIKTSVDEAASKVNNKLTASFTSSAKKCQSVCNAMADSFEKVGETTDSTNQKIQAILGNAEKSAKSKAASIAQIYRKEGMSQSDAMKKAWSEIERTSKSSSKKVKANIKGIGDQSEKTSRKIKGTIGASLKKIGFAIASVFAIKKLVNFSAQCIELGSDLQEVQNVVDVTFPRMSKQVDAFAKNAITSFGLSETMAKRFTGTFGAMAKSFGFTEKAAYDMSTTLTGLAGDVASFYNISQDEAYTKLKSVFTGETESLKDLGVVMTQSALDAYALANGFGKTTKAMSEAEKVALRYAFVQDKLSGATGDFIRTSDSWANQVRLLKLQFDSLKATIGQGLINVLTPVIKVINKIIGKLMSLANAFKAFTEMLMGKKGGGTSAAVSGMDKIAASADGAGAAMGGAAGAAQKAAKKIATATTGIDELNILNPESGEGGGDAGGGGYEADDFDMGEMETDPEEVSKPFEALFERLKELRDLFLDGFKAGLGDVTLGPLMEAIEGIKQSLHEIFTDPGVVEAFNNLLDTMAYSLGQITGAMTSIGITIATNLLGGINLYLAGNKDRIKQWIISMFDITGEIMSIAGNFSQAFANIFSALGQENGQRVTAALLGIFTNAFMGITETVGKLARDLLDVITRPFIENQEGFKTALDSLLGTTATVLEDIKGLIDNIVDKVSEVYDTQIQPMFEALASGLSSIAEKVLDAYQNYIQPVLNGFAERFGTFVEQYVQPAIEAGVELIGKVANAIQLLWTNILQPFIEWFISTIIPVFVPTFQAIVDVVFTFGEVAYSVIASVISVLGGLIDFVVGVFTGEWSLAWEGIKEFFSGLWETLKSLVIGAISIIQSVIMLAWNSISTLTSAIWNGIKAFLSTLWNWISSLASTVFQGIKNAISNAWNFIKSKTSEIWNGIKATLSNTWDTIKTTAGTAFDNIKNVVVDAWNALKEKTGDIWNGIWNTIKGVINNIIGGVENMVNRVVSGVNTMISGLNNIVNKVPGLSNVSIPSMGEVSLPRLAQGGFVRANTPQLAMIGDNRHHGEIVAPEDKLQAMVDRAVAMASGGNNMSDRYLELMVELLQRIIELIEAMDLTVTIDIREIKKRLAELDKRSGYPLRK